MHELAIAMEIVEQAVRIAAENHATRIDTIEVEIGVLRQIVPEALELSFRAAAEGTTAEKAELKVAEERVVAVCNRCECMFLPAIDDFTCPQCKAADARVVAGNEIILKSLVCQADEGIAV